MNAKKLILPGFFLICILLGTYSPVYTQGSIVADSITGISLEGNLLGDPVNRGMLVYLPPGYDTSEVNYPVIYLLHTGGGNEHFYPDNEFPESLEAFGMFTHPADYPDSGFAAMIDSLIITGEIEPLIIVMPDINTAYGGSFCINSVLNGNYEDYIVKDIVPYIDANYRTLANRNSRAIAGHCMGGYGAMYIVMKHPDVFGAVASHSSELCLDALARACSPFVKLENPSGITGPDPSKPFTSFLYLFSAAFSPNPDNPPFYVDLPLDDSCEIREDILLRWADYDPIQMLGNHFSDLQSLRGIYFDAGDKDEVMSYYFMIPFIDSLTSLGISSSFELYDGMHFDKLYTRLKLSLGYLSDVLAHTDQGPTEIPAGKVSGTWTLEGSPYHINGEITIPNGKTLTIEPGVEVIFTGHYKFNVKGKIIAIGTEQDSIIFTADDHSAGWHGLRFDLTPSSNDSSIIEYCRLEYGKANTGSGDADRWGGAIYVRCNKLRVSHCLFQFNMCYHPDIQQTGGGAIGIWGSPIISHCEFKENTSSFFGGALLIWFSTSKAKIYNNYIHHSTGHGTICIGEGASPILYNNLIVNNHSTGHGVIHISNPGGIAVFINNTITNNTCSGAGGAVFVNHGMTPLFINNIIYGNTPAQVRLEATSGLDFINCLIEGGKEGFSGASFTGTYENNIDSDPRFSDYGSADYHISDYSPCIGAGVDSLEFEGKWYYAPLYDIEGNPRPNPSGSAPDIGAMENTLGIPEFTGIKEIYYYPANSVVSQSYPNPFKTSTNITYKLDKPCFVSLKIFDITGQEIEVLEDNYKNAGTYEVQFNAANLTSGIYFYNLQAGEYLKIKKLLLQK
jgi:pimeloyl-ACP methyl ester carboxylesterase